MKGWSVVIVAVEGKACHIFAHVIRLSLHSGSLDRWSRLIHLRERKVDLREYIGIT